MRNLLPWVNPGESTDRRVALKQDAKMAQCHKAMATRGKATRERWQTYANGKERKLWTKRLTSWGRSFRHCRQISCLKFKRCGWLPVTSTSCARFWATTRNIQTLQLAAVLLLMNDWVMLLVCGGWRAPGSSSSNWVIHHSPFVDWLKYVKSSMNSTRWLLAERTSEDTTSCWTSWSVLNALTLNCC